MGIASKEGSATHKLEKNTKMAGVSKNRRSRESLHDSDDMGPSDPASPTREEEKQASSKMRSGSTNAAANNAKKFI